MPSEAESVQPIPGVDELLQRVRDVLATAEPVHSHADLIRIVKDCDLSAFNRVPLLEDIYSSLFLPAVKREYGSTEAFLYKRLGWSPEDVHEARKTGRPFTRDIESSYHRVVRNDWPYGVPREYEHWLVWTLLPLVDWSKAAPFVSERGISGRVCPHSQDASTTINAEDNPSEPVCEEIVAFVKQQWPDASEIFWIVNPVALQTVPGLAHAHVFVRRYT